MSGNKSFTLIELLIVIGILAILVAAVVVVLNPAQLLAQARDSKRQQDLSALNQALNTVYALDQTVSFGTSSIVYTSLPDSSSACGSWGLPSLPTGWTYNCVPTSTLQNTNGTGWIPVNFQSNGVVNLSSLPTDPTNSSSTGLYYTYVTGGSFELTTLMESTKYRSQQLAQASQNNSVSGAYLTAGSNLSLNPLLSSHGLVGWYQFGEGTGTTLCDSSGNGNDATWHGTGAHYVSGRVGSLAGSLDGTDDYITLPTFNLGSISITMWINLPGNFAPVYNPIIFLTDANNTGVALRGNAGEFFPIGGSTAWFRPTPNWIDGWAFIAATVDLSAKEMTVYSDGILSSGPMSFSINLPTIYTKNYLGLNNPAVANNMGKVSGIDDLRIYNRALSASEISALYNATK